MTVFGRFGCSIFNRCHFVDQGPCCRIEPWQVPQSDVPTFQDGNSSSMGTYPSNSFYKEFTFVQEIAI